MAKRDKGTFAFAANYEPTLQAPLDAREVVAAKADLTNVETWSKNGDNVYIYPGMTVKVLAEKKIYMFIGISATVAEVTNPSNWKDVTSGNVFSVNGKTGAVLINEDTIEVTFPGQTTKKTSLKQFLEFISKEYSDLNNNKQNLLVSGTNIKTINGEPILGKGNLEIGASVSAIQFYGIVNNVNTESMSSSSTNLTLVYDAGANMFLAKEGGFIGDAKYYMGAVHQRLAGSSPVVGQIYVFGDRTFVGVKNGMSELFKTDVLTVDETPEPPAQAVNDAMMLKSGKPLSLKNGNYVKVKSSKK